MNGSSIISQSKRCRSPAVNMNGSRVTAPGTRCLVYLRQCLAIQLQKVGTFSVVNTHNVISANVANYESHNSEVSTYWMYDSGYLIFQGFLEANLKCFWNGSLMEAMKVLEFQGYIAPGVLMVSGSACALEVIRAAWSRNVLKPPNNYVIGAVGDVEDCLVEPVTQGQFTPLPEALCWIILDMTASGQAAVMESIYSSLEIAFPDMEKPSQQLVYDTLAKLMAEKKIYQTANGYFIMTPDKMRLNNANSNVHRNHSFMTASGNAYGSKQILLTPDEAVVMMHGEIETVRDGNVTHQAIQTNLADVICGGNPNDKVLYPRIPPKIKSGLSSERLERRHSVRFFNNGRRSSSLQRTGSMKHISDNKKERPPNDSAQPLNNEDGLKKGSSSLLSRIFRRSGRMKRENSVSPVRRPTFSTQFPPTEWFNRGVTHLHSVGTQTSYLISECSLLLPNTNSLSHSQELHSKRNHHQSSLSTIGTPRSIRRAPYSATLPRRKLSSIENKENDSTHLRSTNLDADDYIPSNSSKNNNHREEGSSATDVHHSPSISSRCSTVSNKTIINAKDGLSRNLSSPARKSMSSASSGYNSLPRSSGSGKIGWKQNLLTTTGGSSTISRLKNYEQQQKQQPLLRLPESSITLHVSTNTSPSSNGSFATATSSTTEEPKSIKDKPVLTSAAENSTTTMTVNNTGKTKIFLQQNSPSRSLITFENNNNNNNCLDDKTSFPYSSNSSKTSNYHHFSSNRDGNVDNIIVLNEKNLRKQTNSDDNSSNTDRKPLRPSSLYDRNNFFLGSNKAKFAENACQPFKYNNHNQINNDNNIDNREEIKMDAKNINYNNNNIAVERYPRNRNDNYFTDKVVKHSATKNLSLKNRIDQSVAADNSNRSSTTACRLTTKTDDSNGYLIDVDENKSRSTALKMERASFDENDLEIDRNNLFATKHIPSMNDLTVHFKSLAAQNILKGANFNSLDTLVEVNMAAEKRNCDVNIRTDLGMV